MMSEVAEARRKTILRLYKLGVIKRQEVLRAMLRVPREEFLPPEYREYAYMDTPIPIGYGQTTSALHMTAMFCEYARLRRGMNVLEIGGGSGYMAAVYSEIVARPGGVEGHVYTIELTVELAMIARRNLAKTGYDDRVDVIAADGSIGAPFRTRFDAIIVTAAAPPEVVEELAEYVREGGVMVIPVGSPHGYQELLLVERVGGRIRKISVSDVAFVPLRGVKGWY